MSLFHFLNHTKVSVQVRGPCLCFITISLYSEEFSASCQTPSRNNTTCRVSATSYSIYSQLPSLLEVVPPSPTEWCIMVWWQGSTYHRKPKNYIKFSGCSSKHHSYNLHFNDMIELQFLWTLYLVILMEMLIHLIKQIV
jgi:hypothetical protein